MLIKNHNHVDKLDKVVNDADITICNHEMAAETDWK